MKGSVLTSTVASIALPLMACGAVRAIDVPATPPTSQQLSELWIDPGSRPRDLFLGIGGERYAPPREATFKMKNRDEGGFSVSYDVIGPDGLEWSAKVGPEAQTEVVVSRILWGLGYHQPPIYYLPSWNVEIAKGQTKRESEARFRPKLPRLDALKQYWRWADNQLLGAREFRGLLVALLVLNSTDLKDDNNTIYRLSEPWDGASRWFVVRDLGAALGETGKLYPRRNWLEGFEKQAFITDVSPTRVRFDYTGRHKELLTIISPDDVRWAAGRMQRLTDQQWRDAFRAANYSDADAARFIARIKEKLDDGVALRVDRRVTGPTASVGRRSRLRPDDDRQAGEAVS
jgi:hypothetical protein